MKIGIVGLGDIARKAYLPVMTEVENIELVFCTRSPASLTKLAQKYRIAEFTTDYRELPKLGIDAVMIHAATQAHAEIASFFLQQRMPVFVDKPLADDANSVEQLYERAEKYNKPLYVGFNRRHIPLFNTMSRSWQMANAVSCSLCDGRNTGLTCRVSSALLFSMTLSTLSTV